MPELFVFLLKVNAALIVFCLAYYLILRKLTFYTLNRFFLLAGIVFSSLYPFVDPIVIFAKNEALVKPIAAALPTFYILSTDAPGLDYWLIARIIFWAGVLFMAFRMMIRFYSLYRVHRSSVPGEVSQYQVRFLNGNINTFSFWQNIYLNPQLHQPLELNAVLAHEEVHVKEWHTIDILMAELTTVFYWFNPGVWYMRKAIKENVEFITDQRILQRGVDRRAYQYSMIHTLTASAPSVLMNNFNITGIKRRIIMMNSKKSSDVQLIRYVFLLPVLLVLTTAFTLFKTELKENLGLQERLQTKTRQSPSLVTEKPAEAVKKKVVKRKNKNAAQEISPRPDKMSYNSAEEMAMEIKEADSGKRLTTVHIRRLNAGAANEDDAPGKVRMSVFKIGAAVPSGNPDSVRVLIIKRKSNDSRSPEGVFPGKDQDIKTYIDDIEVSEERMKELNPLDIERVDIQKNDQYPKTKGIRIYTKIFKKSGQL
ncbi:M56 family metallopeptidase [Pedobacter steynii]|uniref:Peptidase M56 domain-containing protein n=1 Tax=Pedobacter steynii TaxID=430522 RepID=A0A1D7QC72_9SPHI|nr:M56 family metallopeptidase [Pedobacter steynii]AOM76159.1 hypothetical protein BFS30_02650 [Pedobacter steynii]